jgi:hypothetical protein
MRGALPFTSPPDDEVEIAGVRGMGIKRGVTVISGGGYSGKSTVLNAISAGIYNHALGDGRELCITNESAVTITAEDGRAVSSLNISPFIKWLPSGDAKSFSTSHASGSTSQAANIIEAVESGAAVLLIDEDRSATNFMIRDSVMKALIKNEPITPFTDRVRELAANGVSTVLVIGGSGEYLNVADKVYMMDEYVMSDVTGTAKELAGNISRIADASIVAPVQSTAVTSNDVNVHPDGLTLTNTAEQSTEINNTPHGLPSAATSNDVTIHPNGLFLTNAAEQSTDITNAPHGLPSAVTSKDVTAHPDGLTLPNAAEQSTEITTTPQALPLTDWSTSRMMSASGFTSYPENSGTERLEVSDTGFIIIGDERVDMRALHDIATPAQTDTLAFMLRYLMNGIGGDVNELERIAMLMRGLTRESSGQLIDISEAISALFAKMETEGFDLVNTGFFTGMNRFLDMPRAFELRAVINRMRRITFATYIGKRGFDRLN